MALCYHYKLMWSRNEYFSLRMQLALTTSIEFYHIYGHQDSTHSLHQFSPDAQLNVLVDSIAQTHLDEYTLENRFTKQPLFSYEG